MLGAPNCPRMDEDPEGPRHRVAGGPLGYQHGMRDEIRAAQQPRGIDNPQDTGSRPVTGFSKGEQGMGWEAESAEQQPRGDGRPVAMEW